MNADWRFEPPTDIIDAVLQLTLQRDIGTVHRIRTMEKGWMGRIAASTSFYNGKRQPVSLKISSPENYIVTWDSSHHLEDDVHRKGDYLLEKIAGNDMGGLIDALKDCATCPEYFDNHPFALYQVEQLVSRSTQKGSTTLRLYMPEVSRVDCALLPDTHLRFPGVDVPVLASYKAAGKEVAA